MIKLDARPDLPETGLERKLRLLLDKSERGIE